MIRLLLSLVIVLAAAVPAQAEIRPGTLDRIRRIPVQHNGREKPFDSFARETLAQITGDERVEGQDPVRVALGILAEPERWQAKPLIAVPFRPLREPLGMDLKAGHISYSDLVASRKLMRMLPAITQKQQRDQKLTMLENETWDAFQRFVAFNQLTEHKLALVPYPPESSGPVWSLVTEPHPSMPADLQQAVQAAWTAFMAALRQGDPEGIDRAAASLEAALRNVNPAAYPPAWRISLELAYNRFQPFRAAEVLYLLAALIWGLVIARSRRRRAAYAVFIAATAVHVAGIACRVVLGGRPPVSNFYETMLWLPFVAVLLAYAFERIYRSGYFALAASLVAAITLILSAHVPLDASITPVVAVLRSNLWLTVHVLTIVASYGALALATVLAHIHGSLYLAGRRGKALEPLDLFLYRAIQVGVVLLAGGIMLGAVWANASWGRYWGWDPKETWALITLLWFIAILHGRFAGWLHGIWIAISTIGGFFLLLMTYYGVSFYLVGLHSYAGGNAKPLPTLLIGYLIAEAAFLIVVSAAAVKRRAASS